MRIEWLPIAARNRDDQLAWLEERSPRAALAAGKAIAQAVLDLAHHPRIGRPGRLAGTRGLVVGGTPYVVAYRLESEGIVILRLLHGAQRWPDRL